MHLTIFRENLTYSKHFVFKTIIFYLNTNRVELNQIDSSFRLEHIQFEYMTNSKIFETKFSNTFGHILRQNINFCLQNGQFG